MAMAPHNDAGPECHFGCCDGPQEGCYCWMCEPDEFPWDRYDTAREAARAWGRWYDGEPRPPMDDDEEEGPEDEDENEPPTKEQGLRDLYQKAANTSLLAIGPDVE